MNIKEDSHLVIKREDISKYLTETESQILRMLQTKIVNGRTRDNKKPTNSYYICNTDEPYADDVKGVILAGEHAKEQNSTKCMQTASTAVMLGMRTTMNTASVTVTMSMETYERLRAIEQAFNDDCHMFEEAYKQNEAGKGMLTDKLKQRISEIYC